MINLLNIDCMEYMKGLDDNAFELAIVDPPYGIKSFNPTSRIAKYSNNRVNMDTATKIKPTKHYFNELFRVSKNQIIWGGNYFDLPTTRGFIFWFKHQPLHTYADGEYAWTSFDINARCFDYPFFGATNCEKYRIHPCQKPVKLYQWLLKNYAKEGDRILDTHLGSGSSAIAAHYAGFEFVGCELDKFYFDKMKERFDIETKQISLF